METWETLEVKFQAFLPLTWDGG